MSQAELEQELPTQSDGLRLRTFVPQNSEEVESLAENGSIVREESNSITSQPIPKSSNYAIPGFMIVISLIQVCTFYSGGNFSWLYWGYDPSRRHEVWRFLTIMFVHSSKSHLWGNLGFQLMYGVPLEIFYHWKRVAIIYTTGILGGTLFFNFFTPNSYGAGASAGVFALNFAQVAIVLLYWKYLDNKYFLVIWIFITCNNVSEDGMYVYSLMTEENDSNISNVGHFGGALTGFLITILVLKNLGERPWVKTFKKICAFILITLTLIIVIKNIAFPSLFPQSKFNTDYEKTFLLEYFKMVDNSSNRYSEQLFLKCIKVKECSGAWAEYKKTGKITHADFIHAI